MARKIRWLIITLLAVLLILFSIRWIFLSNTAARTETSAETAEARPTKLIVLSISDMKDPLSAELTRSIKRLINENENLKPIILDAQGLRSRQLEQLQELDLSGIDGLILSPIDLAGLKEPIRQINLAGIPVVLISQAVGYTPLADSQMTAVCFDAREAGRQQAIYCASQLDGQGKIVILAGPEDQAVTQQMIAGVKEVLRSYPDLTIADIKYGNLKRQSGKVNMIRVLQDHQNIDAVLAQNDEMLLGALPLISGQNTILIKIGTGATTEGLKAISQGYIDGTVSISSEQMSKSAFNLLIGAMNGEAVTNEILQPVLISSDNLDAYTHEIWNIK